MSIFSAVKSLAGAGWDLTKATTELVGVGAAVATNLTVLGAKHTEYAVRLNSAKGGITVTAEQARINALEAELEMLRATQPKAQV